MAVLTLEVKLPGRPESFTHVQVASSLYYTCRMRYHDVLNKFTCFDTVYEELFLTAYHIDILDFLNLKHVAFITREMHKCMTLTIFQVKMT